MLFETVTTNGAAILTMIVLWTVVGWAVTYLYMGRKIEKLGYTIECLDWYAYYSDKEIEELLDEMSLLRNEIPVSYLPTGKGM